MKIYLDLLPQQRKQEIKRKKLFCSILREGALFLLPLIVFIVILFNIFYVLTLQRDNTAAAYSTQQTQNTYQQLGNYEEKFKQVNSQIQMMKKIQSGHLHWQEFFQKLSETIPDGIYISDLSTKNYTVFIVGKARTRNDLLNLKNKLETAPCFQNINVPLSNLVVKDDVDFQIDLSVTEDCLKKQQ